MGKDLLYKTVCSDYFYMTMKYGTMSDFCGSWCNVDVLHSMFKNPSEEQAKTFMEQVLVSMVNDGIADHLDEKKVKLVIENDDKRAEKIVKRYKL